jgi:hypothetical protein
MYPERRSRYRRPRAIEPQVDNSGGDVQIADQNVYWTANSAIRGVMMDVGLSKFGPDS